MEVLVVHEAHTLTTLKTGHGPNWIGGKILKKEKESYLLELALEKLPRIKGTM